jgi:predicted nucleotidyltransferase
MVLEIITLYKGEVSMDNLVSKHSDIIPSEIRKTISRRYKTVTKAINQEFWNSSSDTAHSFYVGSYGRGTAVSTSDIDILVEMPKETYIRYDSIQGNGQSRLLQVVKSAIQNAYPRSDVRADGQVIKINFADDIYFEVLPAFLSTDWYYKETYTYPDTNMGGNWKSTNPKAEQEAMKKKNDSSNGLLQATCRHFRYIRDRYYSSYHLSGIVIDSFVYVAMGNWKYLEPGESGTASAGDYERLLKDYLDRNTIWGNLNLTAPGSGQSVDTASSIECLEKVIDKILS